MSKLHSMPQKIQHLRLTSGLSMRALAGTAGINPATICLMEKEARAVQPKTAKAICEALNCEVSVLFAVGCGTKEGTK